MVYPCFYYSLKANRITDQLVIQTSKQKTLKYEKIRRVVSYTRFTFVASAVLLNVASTVLQASQDKLELQLRIFESLNLVAIIVEYLWVLTNLHKFINLINTMKVSFSTVDPGITRACKKEEKEWFITFIIMVMMGEI